MDACAPTTTSAFSVPQVAERMSTFIVAAVCHMHFLLICGIPFCHSVRVQHRATGQSGVNGAPVQPRCVTMLASRSATGSV